MKLCWKRLAAFTLTLLLCAAVAAGCSRDVIARGAELLGWELDRLLGDTLEAMRAEEQAIEQAVAEAGAKDVDL